MLFGFDESGDFGLPSDPADYRVSVVCGVAVSDSACEELRRAYDNFLSHLSPDEKCKGEAKGRLLRDDHRREFCDLLAASDGVSVTPVTLDLSHLFRWGQQDPVRQVRDLLHQEAGFMLYDDARQGIRLLGRQFGNLSLEQFLRILSLTNCFREALEHAILFLSADGHEESWRNIRYHIDRVQVAENSREEQVMSYMLLSWLAAWSRERPFPLIREIHTQEHPFVQLYETVSGIDIGRLVGGRVSWVSSRDSWIVQIADIAAYIVYRAAMELDDTQGHVSTFARLMRSSFYGPVRGPGLFSPHPDGLPDDVSGNYVQLCKAMERRREQ